MDVTKMWDYRVVRKESKDGLDEWYSIQEVYYDDETGEPMAQSIDLQVEGDTITEMRIQLELMLKSFDEPVLNESDIVGDSEDIKTVEDRVLELEIENAEMRDRLTELSNKILNKEKNFTNNIQPAGEEIDGMYTEDEMEEWDEVIKDSKERGL